MEKDVRLEQADDGIVVDISGEECHDQYVVDLVRIEGDDWLMPDIAKFWEVKSVSVDTDSGIVEIDR